jgi:hypothetical protein
MTDQSSESDSEREAIENAEREERMAQYRKDELLAWAHARAAELRMAEHKASLPKAEPAPVRKYYTATVPTSQAPPRSAQQLDSRDKAVLRAVAVAMIEEEKARMQENAGLRERVGALETELAELRDRLNQQRGLRAVPSSTPSALIA